MNKPKIQTQHKWRIEKNVCVCVSTHGRVSLYLNKGGKEWERGMCARLCGEQKNVRPVKHLEIQLNYITAISLARERSVL